MTTKLDCKDIVQLMDLIDGRIVNLIDSDLPDDWCENKIIKLNQLRDKICKILDEM
jgi:hypothetical protein